VRPLRVAGFDYADESRGRWARLRDGSGREVIVTDHPSVLLAMLRAGVLAGQAKADAEELVRGLDTGVSDRVG